MDADKESELTNPRKLSVFQRYSSAEAASMGESLRDRLWRSSQRRKSDVSAIHAAAAVAAVAAGQRHDRYERALSLKSNSSTASSWSSLPSPTSTSTSASESSGVVGSPVEQGKIGELSQEQQQSFLTGLFNRKTSFLSQKGPNKNDELYRYIMSMER